MRRGQLVAPKLDERRLKRSVPTIRDTRILVIIRQRSSTLMVRRRAAPSRTTRPRWRHSSFETRAMRAPQDEVRHV